MSIRIRKINDTLPPDIPIDSTMSDSSTNPVQNRVIKQAIDANANVIEGISVNGVAQTITNKVVDLIIESGGLDVETITDSFVRLSELDPGIYKVDSPTKIYYGGTSTTATAPTIDVTSTGIIFVYGVEGDNTCKYIYGFGIRGTETFTAGHYNSNGYAQNTISLNFVSNLSAQVRDNLNYQYSTTSYVLSAHQGYVLNQNKENVSNKVTSISSSSTDTQYPSAKAVYDAISNSITNALSGEY